MMLSRPGVSIRRFISQRRVENDCEDGDLFSTDRLDLIKAGRKDAAATAVGPKRRPYGRKRPPPPIIVSREQSIHDILDPLPPIPSYETPRSSDSSLNSSERHNDSSLSQSIDSKRSKSPLCSISSKDDQSQESLQLSSATSYGGDDFPPQLPPRGRARSSESLERLEELSDFGSDTLEAPSARLEDKATSSKQDLRRQESTSSFSDNIQQLIQEADEAFKAVGSALAEVQLAENTFTKSRNNSKELPRIPTPEPSPSTIPQPIPARRASQFPVYITRNSPSPEPQVFSSPIPQKTQRPTSLSTGVKRKKSKKAKKVKTMSMKSYRKPSASKSSAKTGPIWALSDNVTDLFSGKFFHKIEVDEMLTPGQLEAYKLRRESIMQQSEKVASEKAALKEQAAKESVAKKSTETIESETSDTPLEPFHLEDLPSRIGSAGVAELEADATPKAEKPAVPPFEPVAQKDFATEQPKHKFNPRESRLDIGDEPIEYRDATFSTPPMRHAAQLARRSLKTALPSIPETSTISTPQTNTLFNSQNLSGSRDVVADSNYVFLQSAPCSMTSPIFRHGPIRLAKSDLIPDMKVGADEGLDWTAFQMAISGGAGDWFSESDDTIRRREAEEVEDLADWFSSWHFARPGALVTQEYEAPSPTSTTSGEDYSDVSYTEIEKDNPYSPHHQWQVPPPRKVSIQGLRTNSRDMSGLQLDLSKMYPHELPDVPPKESYKEYNCRESYASLPQSPMLDLQVIRSPGGDDVDVVPMGYNLGHDLGDFLKWEAEHVYAGL
ncbi:uncharacterized protein F4822DRAFT_139479 [Hypoxylon trugodes]|uniref:uncharacterized protein n=1 Tax=Hypoxylon trugodes TaxID=326681 RepID=UPI002194C0CA|nr:uncharacterized protein F4822DRAFT_139479 [Hypoxylon trugodes]KAI1392750.1 hypothetical protein F4822DRAFT_139479 [Hypoxylon trugodes]